ncbi:hypothetical protein BGZ51_000693 [Haplosporangium sp. Z 767]|nr:hypothetical protein BGZ50_004910 [Haplosporangium sp. Z 11]KAF9188295.1 hypothetical protein BGZ51_000693 [Haplosporangium sp. Z 767]
MASIQDLCNPEPSEDARPSYYHPIAPRQEPLPSRQHPVPHVHVHDASPTHPSHYAHEQQYSHQYQAPPQRHNLPRPLTDHPQPSHSQPPLQRPHEHTAYNTQSTPKPELLSQPKSHRHNTAPSEEQRSVPYSMMAERQSVRIKIVQQPLHARMCGFGEKDRRPIDPPPIVQLLLDEQHHLHPSKHTHRTAATALTPRKSSNDPKSGKMNKKPRTRRQGPSPHEQEDADEESHAEDDETYQLEEEEQDESSSSPSRSLRKRHRMTRTHAKSANRTKDNHDGNSYSGSEDDDNNDNEHDLEHGYEPEQDPLFVLHASLWSHDGKEVRNMIATPGQSDPPKLTRILMGSVVVSPVLLNNVEGVPGWYFSFPDLSIRTEGVYTLKFSLMRFGSFDFANGEDGHASMLVAEDISDPFTVFSAKKFPGMTESTELSKAFAKQGLKIPIRNDLRVRKADRE